VDNWHGLLELLEDWTVIGGAIAGSIWAFASLPLPAAAAIYAVAIFLIGTRHRSLADLLHQSAHKTLAANRALNFSRHLPVRLSRAAELQPATCTAT